MKGFALNLLDSHGNEHFDNVKHFIAADDNGSFGLLAGHAPMIAVLRYGLARFCDSTGIWRYAAFPGGVLRFADNQLNVVTVRYFLGDERGNICEQLAEAMERTDSEIRKARATLAEIEHSLVRRLIDLSGRSL
ncbi:F0F1 ATP synthase subunit epsilon [Candidatus Methylospira mobilis]|uniref:ATP synthase epsilon chain n=1 Tax=Candidatus Methylospira mobilis TaxID=1808979 RepID=A0A5Q0BEX4_9GAMM|nr:F0F1 ATP synthase subunit epsilon [Candidatus Methylospira mobilis]QFY41682.1 F0F1 ATP synthase subunit epsilon [Candidatus Methylospira mobilis]WNV06534.1 F0F1 ATP synthase subunit epsilon [Candidatus Methylospira mobilis]